LFEFEQSGRRSTTSSVGGHGQIQDELRYTTEPDEAGIESPAMRDLQYATLMTQEQQQPQQPQRQQQQQQQQQQGDVDGGWDERRLDNVEIERPQLVQQTEYARREKPRQLDISQPTAVCPCVYVHCVPKKTRHLIFYHNFGKYELIFRILGVDLVNNVNHFM